MDVECNLSKIGMVDVFLGRSKFVKVFPTPRRAHSTARKYKMLLIKSLEMQGLWSTSTRGVYPLPFLLSRNLKIVQLAPVNCSRCLWSLLRQGCAGLGQQGLAFSPAGVPTTAAPTTGWEILSARALKRLTALLCSHWLKEKQARF